MSSLSEKIRIVRTNNELTQKQLGQKLNVAESTVQKWEVGKANISMADLKELCRLFFVPIQDMTDDSVEIPEYFPFDHFLPDEMYALPVDLRDSEHILIDAGLAKNAVLHRYTNAGGMKCSAIYMGKTELWWHYREQEAQMIHDWNETYGNGN